jgi:hypothetical protein
MRAFAVLLLLVAAADVARSDTLPDVLAAVRKEPRRLGHFAFGENVENRVWRVVARGGDADSVVAAVGEEMRMSVDAARPFTEAVLRFLRVGLLSDETARDEELARITAAYREALTAQPEHMLLLTTYVQRASIGMKPEQFGETLLPLIRAAPDPIAVLKALPYLQMRSIVIADILRDQPNNMTLWKELVDQSWDARLRAAFGPVRLGNEAMFRESWRALDETAVAVSASWQVDGLLQLGRANDALRVADALPKRIRELVMSGAPAALPNGGGVPDVRTGLAMAAFLAGDTDRARALEAAYDGSRRNDDFSVKIAAIERKVLRALIEPVEEPFDVLQAAIVSIQTRSRPGVASMALARVAEVGGYRELASAILRQAGDHVWNSGPVPATPYFDRKSRADLEQIVAAADARRATFRNAAAELAPPADGIAPSIKRLLAQPKLARYVERELTAKPVAAPPEKKSVLPASFWPVRVEHTESNEIVAIAVPNSPFGPDESYWILRSPDGGATWDRPLYTGLRRGHPYIVRQASAVPIANGRQLDLEVRVAERGAYILEIPWQTLRRDSDDDGLTDLFEERIVTDPQNRDTDGDGVDDGADLTPHFGKQQPQSTIADAMARLVRHHDAGGGSSAALRRDAPRDEFGVRTHFVEGDRAYVDAPGASIRRVVLTSAEWKLYRDKFGDVHSSDLRYAFASRDGKRALIVWNERGGEDTFLLTKGPDGEWKIELIQSWIS